MESPWGLGCWATVQSVIPGVESSGAHEPVEAFQAQQILARLELPPAGRRRVVAKRKPRPVPGSKTKRGGELISAGRSSSRLSSFRLSSFRLSLLSCETCGGALL